MCKRRSPAVLTPSRLNAAPRAGPTPFKYLTSVLSVSRGEGCGILWRAQQLPRELRRIERHEIRGLFADAEEFDRDVDGLVDGHHDAAARRTIELRDDEPGHWHGRGKGLRLRNSVLPHGAVEHEQRFM